MTDSRFRDRARYWRTPLLPGADLVTAEYHEHTFAPHWHEAYTIPVIEGGAECFRYRGTQHVAATGSVPVINPGELHTGSRADEEGWRYRVMYVPVDFLHELTGEIAGRAQPLPWFDAEVIHDLDLARRLARAHRLLEADADWRRAAAVPESGASASSASPSAPCADPLAVEGSLLDALSTLLTRYGRTREAALGHGPNDPRVETMKALLAADLATPLRVADLAQAVGLSPFHATRLFTQATGLPPHAWRTQLRLQRALAPLREGATVADVAAASGFTDQSHFTRHFRRMFGVPPGRWQSS
ncbi:helix-turn-helix transcriptional regulator [Paraburkholderia silvatlantica]|uniref:helix-turn-helix transcriptional regulator n=1 Tax=Paraburkholderia silvatlantica TaxID=321895 RepID=UPI00105F943E|nr:AraC family transcriptional regulator [Paraburkholderia silvatlantica]TDR04263.1 AraC family transcriptional regulator [Paraburkholderia silvatlantica]